MTVPWLFLEQAGAKKSATVFFEQDKTVKTVHFSAGDIVSASSNRAEDRTEQFLLRRGRLTELQMHSVESALEIPGKNLGVVLYQLGLLSPQDLVSESRIQVKEIILDLFTWRRGTYRLEEGQARSGEIIPIRMSAVRLINEAIGKLDWQSIRKKLPAMDVVLRPSPTGTSIMSLQDLGADERTVLQLIDGNRTIEEICGIAGIGDFNTLKSICLLLALRLTEKTAPRQAPQKPPVQAPRAEPSTNQADETRAEPAVTRQNVEEVFEAQKHEDDYQVLGVVPTVDREELKKVYFRLAKRYHPDRHQTPEMAELKKKLEAVFSRINNAYKNILDSNAQPAPVQFEEKHAEEYVENYAEKSGSALSYFNSGMKDFTAGNYWGAADAFAWATRLDPLKASYFFYYGMSLAHIPRRRHEAEENLRKAIEIDPLKPDYHLELGGLYLKSGLKAKALDVYHAALRAMPETESIREAIRSAGGDIPAGTPERGQLFQKLFKDKKK